jgi:hypothetical protein
MKAPMSRNIKDILSDKKKSKRLSGQVIVANKLGANPVIKIGDRKITLVRVSPLSVKSSKRAI